MIYTLVDALELSLFGPRPPKDQILEYLKNKKMLLVLDNLEHLLSGIDLMSEILATTPEIKILATSRERLGLQSEHLFDLNGLAVPEANGPAAHSFDALRLFAERAKHTRLDFVLDEHLQDVTRICQLVGGMPLAIELAASWSRLLSPEEIVVELEQSLDILSTSARDLPERHHSMQIVFEVSWQRLSEDEQAALRKLSVFQGGFTREAARAITQIDLRTLFALVNKSFLWRSVSGRFSQHPLLYHYSQQKFAEHPKERSDTQDKHVNYYAGLMMHRWREEFGPQNKEIIDATEVELGNVRAAWPHLLSNQKVEQIDQVTRGLWRYYRYRGSAQAAIDMLTQAVPVLEGKPGHAREVLVSMLTVLARFYLLLGKLAQAKALAEQGLALRHTLDSPIENDSKLLGTLGSVTATLGDYAEARRYCEESLTEVRATNNRIHEAIELHNLAQTILCLGDYAQAEKLHLEGIAIDRELGNLEGISSDLAGLGEVYLAMKDLGKAETAFRESLEIARTIDFRHSIPVALHGLGELAFARGEPIKAQANFEEALGVLVQNPDAELSTRLFSNLARVAICTGNFASSESYVKQALSMAQLSGAVPELLYGLTIFAELSSAKGSITQGVTLLSLLSGYPTMKKRDRNEALKLLEKAKEHLSPRDFTKAREESRSLTLEAIVAEILSEETYMNSQS